MCKKVSVCGDIAASVNMKQLFEDTVSTHFSIYTTFMIADILLTVNMLSFAKTLNSKQYRLPDSLEKTHNFVSLWVRKNFRNFVKSWLWQILNNVAILLNSANVTLSSFFPRVKNIVSLFAGGVRVNLLRYQELSTCDRINQDRCW